MSDEPKEWVTIKIPATIREQAKDDPRTYGEIMQAGLGNEPRELDPELLADAIATDLRRTLPQDVADELETRLR